MLLNQFLKDNSDIEVYDYYTDDGFSGTTFNRPGFEKLLEDLYEKKFNTVIVKDLSRLGRNYLDSGYYIEKYILPLLNRLHDGSFSRTCYTVQKNNSSFFHLLK